MELALAIGVVVVAQSAILVVWKALNLAERVENRRSRKRGR